MPIADAAPCERPSGFLRFPFWGEAPLAESDGKSKGGWELALRIALIFQLEITALGRQLIQIATGQLFAHALQFGIDDI